MEAEMPRRSAAQYAHAVRNVFRGDPLQEQGGHVRHSVNPFDIQPGQCPDPQVHARLTSEAAALPAQGVHSEPASEDQAVDAEAARVTAKFASVDAKTDVVLRFDFMNESDTKAREPQAEILQYMWLP